MLTQRHLDRAQLTWPPVQSLSHSLTHPHSFLLPILFAYFHPFSPFYSLLYPCLLLPLIPSIHSPNIYWILALCWFVLSAGDIVANTADTQSLLWWSLQCRRHWKMITRGMCVKTGSHPILASGCSKGSQPGWGIMDKARIFLSPSTLHCEN